MNQVISSLIKSLLLDFYKINMRYELTTDKSSVLVVVKEGDLRRESMIAAKSLNVSLDKQFRKWQKENPKLKITTS